MQVEQIQVQVQQAAAGNPEAFLALVQEFAPALRLALAAHLEQPGALATVEAAVWAAIRARLGEFDPAGPPFAQWIQQVAVPAVSAHLDQADRRAIDLQDALAHQVIESCREAVGDGREQQVGEVRARFAALPDAARTLLQRRYRERQRPGDMASSLMINEAELATTLAGARAACDWRGIAKAPGPGDRLLPPLIEDWLNGTIDVDSRSLLAANLGRDLERAGQFVRQVRVHLVLTALLAPFTRNDALALARPGGMGESGRVVMGPAPRPVVAARPTSEPRRASRGASNAGTSLADDERPARSSPLPWIIAGVMVVGGLVALIATSTGGAPRQRLAQPGPTAVPPGTPAAAPVETPRPPAAGGVLRVQPDSTPVPARIVLLGPAAGSHAYQGQAQELRALVVGVPNLTEVEYWAGDQRLGAAREVPFSLPWTPTRPGAVQLTARAMTGSLVKVRSEAIALSVVPAFGNGHVLREWWNGLPGEQIAPALAQLTASTPASGRAEESRFAAPRGWQDSYLQRMSGFIIPPLDGDYVFWIVSDDEGELWLSSDASRDHLKRIAISPFIPGGAVPYQAWDHDTRQRSAAIPLRAGQRYYVEALQKEGGGDDYLDVGWQLPDGVLERPIPGAHLTLAPPAPTPTGPPVTPAATIVEAAPAAPTAPVEAIRVLWNGDNVAGGFGYATSGMAAVAGSGRDGSVGLQANLGGDFVNLGWNWFSWFPDDAGSDLRASKAIALWLRCDGANRPTQAMLQFLSSPKSVQAPSAVIDVAALVPQFADGGWHQIVVPLDRLAAPGFNLAKVWEFNLKLRGRGVLAGTVAFDDIVALPQLPAPAATGTLPPPAPAGTGVVRPLETPTAPVPGVAASPWRVLRAINLGGDALDIDGQRWQGQRQAESEGETPATSVQPGAFLSDLPWLRATTAIDQVMRDQAMSKSPLSIGGKVHAKGLGVHANSEIVYALDGRCPGFSAEVGVDDAADNGHGGEVVFQVWGDGQKLWDSGVVNNGTPPKAVSVPLLGRRELRLVVDSNGAGDWDHADWCDARFLRPGGDDGVLMVKNGRRVSASFTPKPATDPRLRPLFGTGLVGNKDGLAFAVRVPNGPCRVWLWLGEPGIAFGRQFDLDVEGTLLAGVGQLPADGWDKLGPIDVVVADGTVDVSAKLIKGLPQVMGILIEQPTTP